MPARPLIDWKKAKREYESTDISYRELASKYKVNPNSVQWHMKRENWNKRKKEVNAEAEKLLVQKLASAKAERIYKELDPCEESIELINALVRRTLQDDKQFNRHLVQKKNKEGFNEQVWTEEMESSVVDTKRLQALASTLKITQDLQRTLKGIISEGEKQRLAIERERLELEKSRQQDKAPDKEIIIKLEGELDEWGS